MLKRKLKTINSTFIFTSAASVKKQKNVVYPVLFLDADHMTLERVWDFDKKSKKFVLIESENVR